MEALLVLSIALCVVLYFALFVKPLENEPPQKPLPVQNSWKRTLLQELMILEGESHRSNPREAMAKFASLVDFFIHKQFLLEVTPLTTSEITQTLTGKCEDAKIHQIISLLQGSDYIKYTTQDPTEEEWQKLFETFKDLINEVETAKP